MVWEISAAANAVIGIAYLGIAWLITRGLWTTGQLRTNRLAVATGLIFFTCGVHHFGHTVHMLLPAFGLDVHQGTLLRRSFDWQMMSWDIVGAAVALFYFSLRSSYGVLLRGPSLFGDEEREAFEERLRHQAYHDELTGLPNRAAFGEALERRLEAAGERRADAFAVLFLDLDRFKDTNDSLGHSAGDELLVEAATRLRVCLRPEDTVARIGGDEFTALLEGVRSREAALRIADRVQDALRPAFVAAGHTVTVTASVGVALAHPGLEGGELMRRADVAMYRAKSERGSRAAVFDPGMSDGLLERVRLEGDLRRALDEDAIGLAFQPMVDLRDGELRGVEALARWTHPEKGEIPPERFIPVAEDSGLIVPLGHRLLELACAQAAQWRGRHGEKAPAVSVNLSFRQLVADGLPARISALLTEWDLPTSSLWLEVTESTMMQNRLRAQAVLSELRDVGVRLAIDDFGTGYSSIGQLRALPFDAMKIDRSFVAGIGRDAQSEAIIATLVALAHSLGMAVVAEGVETDAQAEWLRGSECHLCQGFFLGRPGPPAGIDEILDDERRLEERRERPRG